MAVSKDPTCMLLCNVGLGWKNGGILTRREEFGFLGGCPPILHEPEHQITMKGGGNDFS